MWAAKLVPAGYTHALLPGAPTDAWTVTMNIAHLIVYDEGIAVPVLESLAAGENGTTKIRTDNEAWFYNDAVALAADPLDALLDRFVSARTRQARVAGSFTDSDWNRRWSPVFGSGAHGNGPHSPRGSRTRRSSTPGSTATPCCGPRSSPQGRARDGLLAVRQSPDFVNSRKLFHVFARDAACRDRAAEPDTPNQVPSQHRKRTASRGAGSRTSAARSRCRCSADRRRRRGLTARHR